MRRTMSKEEFLAIFSRQQQSGLSIRDFCENEGYPTSNFNYWKSKYGLTRSSIPTTSSAEFAPVSFRSGFSASSKGASGDGCNDGAITIEFPSGVKIHFRGASGSGTAMQVITQLCHSHALPE